MVAAALTTLLIVCACGAQTVRVVGDAMAPTLKNGDLREFDTGAYGSSSPRRGDVILFHLNVHHVGRVIGLPGETVTIEDGKVSINGSVLSEPYLAPGTQTTAPQDSYVVPSGNYFVLKDNREHATDSRTLGFVPRSAIEGKLI